VCVYVCVQATTFTQAKSVTIKVKWSPDSNVLMTKKTIRIDGADEIEVKIGRKKMKLPVKDRKIEIKLYSIGRQFHVSNDTIVIKQPAEWELS
jgi:hypothetical protein